MLIRFWGTRGSIPSPGPHTARYGGNTACVEIVGDDGSATILDAGTGIRQLGITLSAGTADTIPPNSTAIPDRKATPKGDVGGAGSLPHKQLLNLLLTHCHWDHVQGLPFFEPLRNAAVTARIFLPSHLAPDGDRILHDQLDPFFFPIRRVDLAAEIVISEALPEMLLGTTRVRTAAVDHPGGALAYRLDAQSDESRGVVYAPDSEIDGAIDRESPLVRLAQGARVLIHDAMYSPEEYTDRRGWGHSTVEASLDLAINCDVGVLVLFHHHPDRADAQLDAVLERCRLRAAAAKKDLQVVAAYEGLELEI